MLKCPLFRRWNVLSFILWKGGKIPELLGRRICGYRITNSIFSLTGSCRDWKLKCRHVCIWSLLFLRSNQTICSSNRSSSRTWPAAAGALWRGGELFPGPSEGEHTPREFFVVRVGKPDSVARKISVHLPFNQAVLLSPEQKGWLDRKEYSHLLDPACGYAGKQNAVFSLFFPFLLFKKSFKVE